MNVNFCYRLVDIIVNKGQNGYINPQTFQDAMNQAQNQFLDLLLGEFQQYKPGLPTPTVQFGNNRIVRQSLTPVIYGYILNPDSTGFAPYPGDFQEVDAMWSLYGYNKVKYVQQEYLSSYYNSQIDPIPQYPIYVVEQLGFRFFPNNIGQTKLNYVQTPPRIIWGYTEVVPGQPVYNPATSVDPVWYDSDMMYIIARALRMFGVNLQAQEVNAYAQEMIFKMQ